MGTIEIELQVEHPLEVYTNGDTISGTAVVVLEKDVSIGTIEITLQCVELATITRSNGSSTYTIIRKHKHFNEGITVFPPPDVPSTGGYHTLPQGRHAFPFSLQLPLNPALPETRIYRSDSYVKWQLKAHVEREASLKRDGRRWLDFRFVPARIPADDPVMGERGLVGSDRVDFKTYTEGYKRSLTSVFSNKNRLATTQDVEVYACPLGVLQWPLPSTLDIVLRPSAADVATLRELRIALRVKDRVFIDYNRDTRRRMHGLLDAKDLDIPIGKELPLQRVLEAAGRPAGLQVPSIGAGSFTTLHNSREVELRIDLYFGSRHHPGAHKHRKIWLPVVLAPESVAALRASDGLAPPPPVAAADDSDDEAAPPYEAGEKGGEKGAHAAPEKLPVH